MPSYLFPSSGQNLLCFRPLQLRTTRTGLPSFQFLDSAPFLSLTGTLQLRASALKESAQSTKAKCNAVQHNLEIYLVKKVKTLCTEPPYRFMWVSVWSHDCSAVLLFPERSRPPEPVYVNSLPSSWNKKTKSSLRLHTSRDSHKKKVKKLLSDVKNMCTCYVKCGE